MGGSFIGLQIVGIFFTFILSPAFAGLKICCALDLGLAPQALCFRLLRRL
jgi:hypothetical protein